MIYILLPSVNISVYDHIHCTSNPELPVPIISHSHSHYLYDIKNKIKSYGRDWDEYRQYTNPYEYINTMMPNNSKCVSKYKPLSRSYFKMLELIQFFDLLHPEDITGAFSSFKTRQLSENRCINSFHLAEGPGGFIEALANLRKDPEDTYVGMTIMDSANDSNIPAWKKSEHFLRCNPNVFLENGSTGTGDILSVENFAYCVEKYGSKMDLITADGGFDFSSNFNNQEIDIGKLLFGQICYALCLQKKHGHFVLKIFDCFMAHTIDLLYMLSAFYEKVYITKPNTSRYANSEKYIVCKNFLFSSNDIFLPKLKKCLEITVRNVNPIHRFLTCSISNYYLNKIEEYNAIFGQQHIENIQQTIILIENKHKHDKIENYIKSNTTKCVNWCVNHNIPHNIYCTGVTHNNVRTEDADMGALSSFKTRPRMGVLNEERCNAFIHP